MLHNKIYPAKKVRKDRKREKISHRKSVSAFFSESDDGLMLQRQRKSGRIDRIAVCLF